MVGDDELTGSVTSGDFCGIPGNYTLYFVARFSTPFAASGTWHGGAAEPTASCAGTAALSCGAWVSFRRPGETAAQTVMAKVGISYVSAAGAAGNLATEDPGLGLRQGVPGGHGGVERASGPGGCPGRHHRSTAHFLHRPLPLASLPFGVQ